MRSQESQLVAHRLRSDNEREAISPSPAPEVYKRKPITLPSSLCKPSLRAYFDWDDRGNDDYAKRPALLDLFSGGGGAAMGYYLAGFRVVGIDLRPQPHYPFEFHEADALAFLAHHGREFDAIHASPPCQAFTLANYKDRELGRAKHDNMIPDCRRLLCNTGVPWIIENVPQAPLLGAVTLCGTMFDLGVFRHRKFEANFPLSAPAHEKHTGHIGDGKFFSVAGGAGRWKSWGTVKRNITRGSIADWKNAMGIDWMVGKEITQAIPPAYTEWIGKQLIDYLGAR